MPKCYYSELEETERQRHLMLCHSLDVVYLMDGTLCGLCAINEAFKPGTNQMLQLWMVGHVKLL